MFGGGVFVCARCDSLGFNYADVCVVICFTVILNPTDFDFLLSKGRGSQQINPRDSILERFDPILGRPSVVADFAPKAVPPVISTIPEVDSSVSDSTAGEIDVSLVATEVISSPVLSTKPVDRSPVEVKPIEAVKPIELEPEVAQPIQSKPKHSSEVKLAKVQPAQSKPIEVAALISTKANESVVKLDSSLDRNQLGDSGEHSQASSTTETYETASTGEPFKVRVLHFGYIRLCVVTSIQ